MISIIIPVLNEEYGIQKTIDSIPKTKLNELGYNLEILVIDGNSADLTRDAALRMGAKVIEENTRGYGRAIKKGLEEATGDIIVTLDGDNTYPAELIPQYLEKLIENDSDFVTINRLAEVEKGALSFLHKVGNKILSLTFRLLYSIDIKDSQSGMCLMKRQFIDKVNVISDDFAFCEELRIIAFKFFRSLELEGKYYRRIGESKLQTIEHGWTNFIYLFKYKKLINSSIKPIPQKEQFNPASEHFPTPKNKEALR
jgi:glycosyltransferase involved in cell wall biosynthesis